MKKPTDPRIAFLGDPELYAVVMRVALRIVRDETLAEDMCHGAYLIAVELVLERNKSPKAGLERGWICNVARYHTYAELRRRKEEPAIPQDESLADDEGTVQLSVEDRQTLWEEQEKIEQRLDAVAQVAAEHPEQAELLLGADGRTKAGGTSGPKDAKTRKRAERARAALGSRVTAMVAAAAVAAIVVFVLMRNRLPVGPGLPRGGYATLADASHELARESCAAQEWAACIENLKQLRTLDPKRFGPDEQGAWSAAAVGIRYEALVRCAKGEVVACIAGLDEARELDPEGDNDPTVTLARIEAAQGLGQTAPSTPLNPDAKVVPGRQR
jgi:hypothetical protein